MSDSKTHTCGAEYQRYPSEAIITCQFLRGHVPTNVHSWQRLAEAEGVQRDQDMRATQGPKGVGCDDDTPDDVRALLDAITQGNADPYLEAILAVTHNRKRALRGTRGFGNL